MALMDLASRPRLEGCEALALAKKLGLAAVDALHLASALRQGVEQSITNEWSGQPRFRVAGIKVISLHAS